MGKHVFPLSRVYPSMIRRMTINSMKIYNRVGSKKDASLTRTGTSTLVDLVHGKSPCRLRIKRCPYDHVRMQFVNKFTTTDYTGCQDLQEAVSAPRWLLGRTWGAAATSLRIEDRIDPAVIKALRAAGHEIEMVGPFDEVMGHAGALVWHPDGLMEGAADPRSDGQVSAF